MTAESKPRRIHRTWGRSGVSIETINDQYGPLYRGRIYPVPVASRQPDGQARGQWVVQDQDHVVVVDCVLGDYLDAEQRLLEATTWADQEQ